jgi:hypothetical protein
LENYLEQGDFSKVPIEFMVEIFSSIGGSEPHELFSFIDGYVKKQIERKVITSEQITSLYLYAPLSELPSQIISGIPKSVSVPVSQLIAVMNSKERRLEKYKFSSNGPYDPSNHVPQNLLRFDPAPGYGLAASSNCFMEFQFPSAVSIQAIIIGSNSQVTGGWGPTYLEGVQVQIDSGSGFQLIHSITGMPAPANHAYVIKVGMEVLSVKMVKASYFSVSFVHFA